MIKVYGLPRSRSTRVLWELEESGKEYEFVALDFQKGEQLGAAYRQLNPAAKVPVLVDDSMVLTESAAIVNYVLSKYSAGLVPPADLNRKAEYDRWCFFALAELEQGLWTMAKHRFALPPERRVPAIIETAQWEYQRSLSVLSEGLGEKPYILGGDFSGADILIGHTLLWGIAFKQPAAQENLQAYAQRLDQRPALNAARKREGSGQASAF